MNKNPLIALDELEPLKPAYALAEGVDLVVIRYVEDDEDRVSVLFGRCLHRGALLSDGHIDGDNLICGLHGWDYRYDTGVSEYNNDEALAKFESWIVEIDGARQVLVDLDEIRSWVAENPQPYDRDAYLGLYADIHGAPEEPHNDLIQSLARDGLSEFGHHGPSSAMGVDRRELPSWDDLQIVTGQLARRPLFDDDEVATETIIGPRAEKPLTLKIPLFVSDMSFGALSKEAKVALSRGAELAGTGICSGEGGMLPEEQEANSRYFYEMASARFGFSWDKVQKAQAFHFKGGQAAKTGTGGHLPGEKVTEEIAGGVPVGFKLSAQRIEADLDFALEAGVDYIILDGRGGGTGSAPLLFRDHISVPTLPALARARRHLDASGHADVTLVITGGLRVPADFIKALALGADAIAVANSAIQAIGCLGMRACHTNNCPVGIATQKENLRARLMVEQSAKRLQRFFESSVELMQVMARACGHDALSGFGVDDLVAWKREIADLTGVRYAGVA